MSGTVVIVTAALLAWFVLSVAVALLVGHRLGQDAPAVTPSWLRPVPRRLTDDRERQRRSAA